MRYIFIFTLMTFSLAMTAQDTPMEEKYQRLPFGSIKPSGWLKKQMQGNMRGFTGHLDQLVPALFSDSIYGSQRLHRQSRARDLGNLKSGDAGGDDQYKWWNSETQSNWWDGYIRNALLLGDTVAMQKIQEYMEAILATRDEDGYLGIYEADTRYAFTSENGELWSKTTLLRGMLAWYEATGDRNVWEAIVRAVDNVMLNYPVNVSQPFYAGRDFSGGVAHGLTFTDVLDRMHQLTGDRRYASYAAFLYLNFSENFSSEKDVQLGNIKDSAYRLQMHGVHTYEHMRPLLVAARATGRPDLEKAFSIYEERIQRCTTPTGGAIGDEWIGGRTADATMTGYEYCSLHELMDSYTVMLQKTGDLRAAGAAERIFFNAAQGSRDPDHSCIAYLKTDNSFEMTGTKNGEEEPGRVQTRYKYSPVHQDVAVCCAPNAGRISPYFVQSCWLKEKENTLVASMLCPNVLKTTISGVPVTISEITEYPWHNHFVFKVDVTEPVTFRLKIRRPEWCTAVKTREDFLMEDGFIVISRKFSGSTSLELEFLTEVSVQEDLNHDKFFRYGALVFASPLEAVPETGRIYGPGFADFTYSPKDPVRYEFLENHRAEYQDGKITAELFNLNTGKPEKVSLFPVGKTILRQVTFPAHR